jgi:hypothetical protein
MPAKCDFACPDPAAVVLPASKDWALVRINVQTLGIKRK